MTRVRLGPLDPFRARLRVPGDKSIGHRALVLNAVAEGTATVSGLAPGRDLASTFEALRSLGIAIRRAGPDRVEVRGGGPWRAAEPVDCGNSGTTARLLLGLLAPRATARVTLAGDRSLCRRPMRRVVGPLLAMGARIEGAAGRVGEVPEKLPLAVTGAPLRGAEHRIPVASAQVKSAILLAGLAADGATVVEEPGPSRDHTERMLERMGAAIERDGRRTALRPGPLAALDVEVPGDFSSAAPFLALAAARLGSEVVIEDLGLNPTRTGLLAVLREMGAGVEIEETGVEIEETGVEVEKAGVPLEPRGTVRVTCRDLAAIRVDPALVPRLIDELPLVAVLGTQAEGETIVTGASELRVKESDRIEAIVTGLRAMGADVEPLPDGFAVRGPTPLSGARIDAASDHRIGMALAVAAALATGGSEIEGGEWVDVSYPGFFERLGAGLAVGA